MNPVGRHKEWALFDRRSTSQESPYIYVPEEYVAEFTSFGFQHKMVSDPRCPQTAELCAVITSEPENLLTNSGGGICGQVLINPNAHFTVIDEFPITAPNCEDWFLDSCSNIKLLDIPGCYRLVLNEPEAVGVVRVYLKFWLKEHMTRNSRLYFGG